MPELKKVSKCSATFVDVKDVKQKNIGIWFSDTGTIPQNIYKKLEHQIVMRKKSKVAETTEIEFITNFEDLSEEGRQELEEFSARHGIKAVDYTKTMDESPTFSKYKERVTELVKAAVYVKQYGDNQTRREALATASDIARFASIDGANNDTACAYLDINDERLPCLDQDLGKLQKKMENYGQPFIQAGRVHKRGSRPYIEARNDVMITKKSNNPKLFQKVMDSFDKHLDSNKVKKLHKRVTEGVTVNHHIADNTISVDDNSADKNERLLSLFASLCCIKDVSHHSSDLPIISEEQSRIEIDLHAIRKHKPMTGHNVLEYAHTMAIIDGDYKTGAMWLRSDSKKTVLNQAKDGTIIDTNSLIFAARDHGAAFTWTKHPKILQNLPDFKVTTLTKRETIPLDLRQDDWTIEEYKESLHNSFPIRKPKIEPSKTILGTKFITYLFGQRKSTEICRI